MSVGSGLRESYGVVLMSGKGSVGKTAMVSVVDVCISLVSVCSFSYCFCFLCVCVCVCVCVLCVVCNGCLFVVSFSGFSKNTCDFFLIF